jgi:hypothetical protein
MMDVEIDSLITRRLIDFHSAMVRRGQIPPASDPLPRSLVVAGCGEVVPDVRLFVESDGSIAGS